MSLRAVRAASDQRILYPNAKFAYLAGDHVCVDDLTSSERFEARTLRAICSDPCGAAIIGPIGAGKSSMIAHICDRLPDTHIALRVPVVGVDDPTSTSAMAAMALASALSAIELEDYQRAALQDARADQTATTRSPATIGGKLGGGALPIEVSAETKTLQTQLATNKLAGDRLSGLDRLVNILIHRNIQPIFVLEDTEAAIGGSATPERIEAFFQGPVTAFLREVDASFVIAVQEHIADQEPFQRIAPGLLLVELPRFDGESATSAISSIVSHRLGRGEPPAATADVFTDDAVTTLGASYSQSRSVRHVLAAAQSATDHAADAGADITGPAHVEQAVMEWIARAPVGPH